MNRALLVGVNKYPSQPLHGCINDIQDMAKFLVERCNFSFDDIRLLVDSRATRDAIIERLGWLLSGIRSGDRVFFHFSGHGAQLPTRNPQGEVDGLDEVICPVDFDWTETHTIRDKDFHKLFSTIPEGVEFVWISDSCHSGDLSKEMLLPKTLSREMTYPPDIYWRLSTAKQKGLKPLSFSKTAAVLNLALISGCLSNQTSADAFFGNKANGALTYFLLKQLNAISGLSMPLTNIVEKTKAALKNAGYEQEPQLEGNVEIMKRSFLAA